MYSKVLRPDIFTDIKCLDIEVQLGKSPDTGLARLPQCQSGLWRFPITGNGKYHYLGRYKGTFVSSNTTAKPFKIYVTGGNPPPKKINSGGADNCANTFSLIASVNGITIANAVVANSNWGKSGSIVFDVPIDASFKIISNGMMDYGCDYGSFSVVKYL